MESNVYEEETMTNGLIATVSKILQKSNTAFVRDDVIRVTFVINLTEKLDVFFLLSSWIY